MKRPTVRDDLALQPGYHSPQLDVEVRLNTNEAPEPPPPGFRAALADELAAVDWHRYPDRSAMRLRTAIAAHHDVEAAQVFVANGSNEVLQTLCLTYGGPGRTVATFEPTYALHSHIPRITNTGVVSGERTEDFALDMNEVRRVLNDAQPTITFLCSPNNPTGMIETGENIRAVAEMAPGLLVVDEAYGQFAPWSALELVDRESPIVVTRTYSKTWSMAAARLGYLIGPDWLVDEMYEVVLPYHLDAFKQAAGVVALRFEAEMQSRVATLVEERGRVSAALAELPVTVWPSASNFILFRPWARAARCDEGAARAGDTGDLRQSSSSRRSHSVDGDKVWKRLVDRSVLVRNCASWPRLDGCLRLTIGTAAENDRFLAALADVLEDA